MADALTERLEFYGLANETANLQRVGRKISGQIDRALTRFYAKISATPVVVAVFSGRSQMDHAASAQKSHWQALFANGMSADFLRRSTVIGNVHAKIGLDPKWYIGGYSMVLDDLIKSMVAPGILRLLPWKRRQAEDVALLVRAALLDMDLALSSYFVQEQNARQQALGKMGEALAELSAGNLGARMRDLPPEYAVAEHDFNAAVANLEQTVSGVIQGIGSITSSASEIRTASEDLAMRNEQQAASLEESAAAMNQVTASVRLTADNANRVQGQIAGTNKEATDGGVVVHQAVEAMAAIETSAKQITQITNLIDGIAFQTNLLALNAGVEAARAGDAGRGFAVVANEVRALAQRSADAARDIKGLIATSTKQVSEGVELVGETGRLLEKIVGGVGEINHLVQGIATSANAQAANLQQVNDSVGEMDRMTQQNAAMVEQSTAASRSLADEAASLSQLVSGFQVTAAGGGFAAAIPLPMRKRTRPVSVGNLALKINPSSADDWSEF